MKSKKIINYSCILFACSLATVMFSGCNKSGIAPIDGNIDQQNTSGYTYTFTGSVNQGFTNGPRVKATFNNPNGIAIDAAGNLYVADQVNNAIRKVTPNGLVTTLAGSGAAGFTNGTGASATFNNPVGIAVDASGNVFVADLDNNAIREITPAGVVTTFAGTGAVGFDDGPASTATFNGPSGIVVDHSGNIFVSDNHNVIRKITPGGIVSTFAGKVINTPPGFANGTGADANFRLPNGLAVDIANNIYVADYGNNMIRKITPDAVVTTLAGQLTPGSANGPIASASFSNRWM